MPAAIRILVVEDSIDDYVLLLDTFARQGLKADCVRVETCEQMQQALSSASWDLIVSDHQLPSFSSGQVYVLVQPNGTGTLGTTISTNNGGNVNARRIRFNFTIA